MRRSTKASIPERALAAHMRMKDFPLWVEEHAFAEHLGRRFRFDFAWPDRQIAVEVDSDVHRIRKRFDADMEKMFIAQALGWHVLRVTSRQIRKGEAIRMVSAALGITDPLQELEAMGWVKS